MAITGTANPATAAAGSADTISGTVSDPSGQGVPTGVVTLAVSLMSPAAQQHGSARIIALCCMSLQGFSEVWTFSNCCISFMTYCW